MAGRHRLGDIFRLDYPGKSVEHWDVLQRVPAESANDRTNDHTVLGELSEQFKEKYADSLWAVKASVWDH
jgi:hypothetical protein